MLGATRQKQARGQHVPSLAGSMMSSTKTSSFLASATFVPLFTLKPICGAISLVRNALSCKAEFQLARPGMAVYNPPAGAHLSRMGGRISRS